MNWLKAVRLHASRYLSYWPIIRRFFKRFLNKVTRSKTFQASLVVILSCCIAIWVSDSNSTTKRDIATILFQNAEPIAIASAAAIFLLEIPNRQKSEQYEAWQVMNSAVGQTGSGGRIQALEDLNRSGVDLEGVAVQNADLSGVNLEEGKLRRANFEKAQLNTIGLTQAQTE